MFYWFIGCLKLFEDHGFLSVDVFVFRLRLVQVEDTLTENGGPFFLGERFSLVDIMCPPSLGGKDRG